MNSSGDSIADLRRGSEPGVVPGAAPEQECEARSLLALTLSGAADPALDALRDAGWKVAVATDLQSAHRLLQQQRILVGLVFCGARKDEDVEVLDAFLNAHRTSAWVGVFDRPTLSLPACRELILNHLFDHYTAPVDAGHLAFTLGHAHGHASLRRASAAPSAGPGATGEGVIIGNSEIVKDLMRQLRRVAKVDAPVLISGESGSGKELAAQAIHRFSARSDGPFIAVNCGAIQPTLIQSALFGHVKGSFTGATRDERGLIEAASGGTIFLDEIGDLSLELQINLLRFLQERTITRVGSTRSIPVDARVVAATHVQLEKAIDAGNFRSDLFYRLNVLPVTVPPLRARRADIPMLAQHFFDIHIDDKASQVRGFSQSALRAMTGHDWPGNVRELINRIRRAMVMAEGRFITSGDLGLDPGEADHSWDALVEARGEAERSAIMVALTETSGNITNAAKHLGVSRMTLYRLIDKHAIAT